MSSVPELFLHQVFQLTLVIAIALLCDRLLNRMRRHRLRYVLWILVLFKALIPPVVASPTGLFSLAQSSVEVVSDCGTDVATNWTSQLLQTLANFPVVLVVAVGIWATGVALLVAWTAFRCYMMTTDNLDEERQRLRCEALVAGLSDSIGLRRVPKVRITATDFGPAVYGLIRPTVVVPLHVLESLTDAELRPILTHELVHIRRRDTWVGFLQLCAAIVWWFHPLVWVAIRRLSNALEYVTDDDVVAVGGVDEHNYAGSLLSVIEAGFASQPAVGTLGVFSCEVTQHRVTRLINRETSEPAVWRSWAVAILLALFLWPGRGLTMVQSIESQRSAPAISNSMLDE
ncbi:MAG: M56 family metallopeptidase [Planctomycetota bacterium]